MTILKSVNKPRLLVLVAIACLAGVIAARGSIVASIRSYGLQLGVPLTSETPAPIRLTSPTPNAAYIPPASVTLTAAVTGEFSQVDFYNGTTLLGTARSAPYTLTWMPPGLGTYTLMAVGVTLSGAPTQSAPVTVAVKNLLDLPLIQKTALHYEGAFRVPSGTVGTSSFGYSGPIAFNPAHNSLFWVGHDWQQHVSEISIPDLVNNANIEKLQTSTVLQTFADPVDGKAREVNPGDPNDIKVGGLLVTGNKLLTTQYAYYDGSGRQSKSHFVSSTDLANKTDTQGPFTVTAPQTGFVSGFMASIPEGFQGVLGAKALTGQCCIPIISRTSYGPPLFAFNPEDLGTTNPVVATPLAYYPEANPLVKWEETSPLFNGTSKITGVVFPEGTRTVLFFGRQGTGRFCYGTGAECGDPMFEDKGVHGYPYVYQVWAYDAAELVDVKNRLRQPWSVRPYAYWQLSFPQQSWATMVNGATYDPATGRIYVSQAFVDGPRPLVHVYTLDMPTTSAATTQKK